VIDEVTADRFWAKVNRRTTSTDGCWPWLAGVDKDGYGRFRLDGRPKLAHVVAWELTHGRVPAGRRVHRLSTCSNRACVRPEHLRLGDQASAIRARDKRGNGPAGERNAAAKLTAEVVAELRAAGAGDTPVRELAERFGLHTTTVSDILAGRLWAATLPPQLEPPPDAGGRPSRVFDREQAEAMRAAGASLRKIAAALGVPKSIVARHLTRE
jgi:DNA-binding MarR family transcriptional regulator